MLSLCPPHNRISFKQKQVWSSAGDFTTHNGCDLLNSQLFSRPTYMTKMKLHEQTQELFSYLKQVVYSYKNQGNIRFRGKLKSLSTSFHNKVINHVVFLHWSLIITLCILKIRLDKLRLFAKQCLSMHRISVHMFFAMSDSFFPLHLNFFFFYSRNIPPTFCQTAHLQSLTT